MKTHNLFLSYRGVIQAICLVLLCKFNANAGVDPLQFVETPPSSGFFTASVTNTFDGLGAGQARQGRTQRRAWVRRSA